MRRRFLLFGIVSALVLLGCYGIWIGNSVIAVVFTGLSTIITIAQAFFPFPLGNSHFKSKLRNELILPPAFTPTKKSQTPNMLYRVIEIVFNPLLPKIGRKAGLILPERYVRNQQRKRSEAIARYAFSVGLLPLSFIPMLFILGMSWYSATAPQGSCTILTKDISGGIEPIDASSGIAVAYYNLQFTFRLQTIDGEIHTSVVGSTSVNPHPNGVYLDLQEAQQQLNRYLIGKTYPCQYRLLFNFNLSAWLISDKPISSSSSRSAWSEILPDQVFWSEVDN